jgi:hypothetical protein
MAPELLPSAARIELRKHAQAAAQAADGNPQVVDGFGVARARGARNLETEAPQENQGLLVDKFAHRQDLAFTTEMGYS